MKIKREHYETLASAVRIGAQRIPSAAAYEARDPSIRGAASIKDPAKRRRWDALWAAGQDATRDVMLAVYDYANDERVDTALRAIMRDIEAQDRAYTGQDPKFSAALAAITREGK